MGFRRTLAPVLLCSVLLAPPAPASGEGVVNVYTYREEKLIRPLFDAFTKDTGVAVNVVSAANGLEQRIATEGTGSLADILLTVDISRLAEAVRLGITQPLRSPVL